MVLLANQDPANMLPACLSRGGFRLSRSKPLVTQITVFFSQNVRLIEKTRPFRSLMHNHFMELILLLLPSEEPRPELLGKGERIGLNAISGEIAAKIFYVALQKEERVRVVPWVDGLREVDDLQFSLPVENIER